MGIISLIKGWWHSLLGKKDIEQALSVKVAIPDELKQKYDLYRNIYNGEAPWNDEDNPSLRLASTACSEVAISVTNELETGITGSPRAEYLDEQYQKVINELRNTVEKLCYNCVLVWRPFIRGGEIRISAVENDCFYPLKYNSLGEITSIVFAETMEVEENYYTLLEKCTYEEREKTYTIEYSAWKSDKKNSLGKKVSLTEVPEWSNLREVVPWTNVERPWFVVLKMPGNGEAVFAKAIDMIKQADKQFGRTVWEYEGGELAIDAPADLFRESGESFKPGKGVSQKTLSLPKGKERLFRLNESDPQNELMKTFNPAFRDVSLFNGLDKMKREIERACNFSYGMFSEPQNVDKSATEVKSSRHTYYQTVNDIQKVMEAGLLNIVTVMDDMATRYRLAPIGAIDQSFWWDDSILKTTDEKQAEFEGEFKRQVTLFQADTLSEAELMAFYYENSDFASKVTDKMVKEALKRKKKRMEMESTIFGENEDPFDKEDKEEDADE